jgi:hypothetical protein
MKYKATLITFIVSIIYFTLRSMEVSINISAIFISIIFNCLGGYTIDLGQLKENEKNKIDYYFVGIMALFILLFSEFIYFNR